MIDQPDQTSYKIHSIATPRAGGMAILAAGLAAGALTGFLWEPPIRSIFLAGLIIFVLGAIDDARGMNAATKLVGQGLATAVLIQSGVVVQILRAPIADTALTVLWVVGVTNAYNFVDSMDGEALGLAGVAAGFLMLAMTGTGQDQPALFAAAVMGACGGLLYYNISPARLFLGDSGSQLLGFWLAALGIVFTPARTVPQLSSWFVPILIMIVPILDTTLVTLSRARRRLPVYKGNRDHTYHRLVALGIAPQRAVFIIQLASVIAGCLAIISLALPPLWANSIFFTALALGLAVVFWLGQKQSTYNIA
jgi:UDP-GlcNAc:undecaprenyl-phosphate GlcNAc-1-phosphate transferase